jgi:polyhydroxyalkanoate synthesis regulator phasin
MDDIRVEMIKGWKSSWESYVNTLSMMQEQGEKMIDLLFTQSENVQKETKKLMKESISNAQEAQRSYFQAVDENFNKMEELLAEK